MVSTAGLSAVALGLDSSLIFFCFAMSGLHLVGSRPAEATLSSLIVVQLNSCCIQVEVGSENSGSVVQSSGLHTSSHSLFWHMAGSEVPAGEPSAFGRLQQDMDSPLPNGQLDRS